MNETNMVTVEKELHVNEATLDYLRRRIEGDVKGNFFRWIGLPVGGVGLVTIFLTIFLWIPEKIESIIETNPTIQKTLDQSATEYLDDPQRGQLFINEQLQSGIESYFKDPQLGQQLIQELIKETASAQIENITEDFFRTKGEPLIRDLAETYLNSPHVREVLTKAIDAALKPKINSLSTEIRNNTEKLVVEVSLPARDTKRIDKSTMNVLFDFLGSTEALSIRSDKRPVALALTVRRGRRYDKHAVVEYINRLTEFFGKEFDSILVLDRDDTFVARLKPEAVKVQITPNMQLFNTGPQVSSSAIRARLEQMHGTLCTTAVQSDWKVFEALASGVWRQDGSLMDEVPVLDDRRVFIGLTSRARLIEGVLG